MRGSLRGFVAAGIAAVFVISTTSLSADAYAEEDLSPAVKIEAADRYLKAICPLNAARDALYKRAKKIPDSQLAPGKRIPNSLIPAIKRVQGAYARSGRLIGNYQWPAELRYSTQTIAEAHYQLSSHFGYMAQSKRWASAPFTYTGAAVAQIRLYLGLPPANSKNDRC